MIQTKNYERNCDKFYELSQMCVLTKNLLSKPIAAQLNIFNYHNFFFIQEVVMHITSGCTRVSSMLYLFYILYIAGITP